MKSPSEGKKSLKFPKIFKGVVSVFIHYITIFDIA